VTLLVPMIPVMDAVAAEPDSRQPHGIRYWSTDLKALIADYAATGVEWVHLQDVEGRRLGRLVESCAVTEIAVVKEIIVSVEGGIRTWQDARLYLGQAVDLVYLGEADGWPPVFHTLGQQEVERRLLYEVSIEADWTSREVGIGAELAQLTGRGVIPVLTSTLPLPELVRAGNLAGVATRHRLVLRPATVGSLEEWEAGLLLTGGFVQAIMVQQRCIDRLGLANMLAVLRHTAC